MLFCQIYSHFSCSLPSSFLLSLLHSCQHPSLLWASSNILNLCHTATLVSRPLPVQDPVSSFPWVVEKEHLPPQDSCSALWVWRAHPSACNFVRENKYGSHHQSSLTLFWINSLCLILREIAAVENVDFFFNVMANENENSLRCLDFACLEGYSIPSLSPLCCHILSGDLASAPQIGPIRQD